MQQSGIEANLGLKSEILQAKKSQIKTALGANISMQILKNNQMTKQNFEQSGAQDYQFKKDLNDQVDMQNKIINSLSSKLEKFESSVNQSL